MEMEDAVYRDGTFRIHIRSGELSRGLRPSVRSPRNSKFLVQAVGAVGRDQVLHVIDDLNADRINTSVITDSFPYPQIFVCAQTVVICGETAIYEWDGSSLTLMISGLASGEIWSLVDFNDYLYLTNGQVAVTKSATDGTYNVDTDVPTARALCNYNGQVLAGSPVE